MIANQRNKKPVISFGLGKTELTVTVGTVVSVWLDTIYRQGLYTITMTSGTPKGKISDQQFTVTPSATGTFQIFVSVSVPDKSIDLKSNKITLIVE